MRPALATLALTAACNGTPDTPRQGVGFRDGLDGGPQSGERGSVKITEVLWSGAVPASGVWDPTDVFVEIRNESARPLVITGWQIVVTGANTQTYPIPEIGRALEVGAHWFFAAKDTGCFPDPDAVLPGLAFFAGDPVEVTLLDADDRLIEPIGADDAPPFAGGYDLVESRSMERVELMFGAEGTSPTAWHYYTQAEVEVPNNDRIAPDCAARTLASPGRPNSPDYSGATASGSLE